MRTLRFVLSIAALAFATGAALRAQPSAEEFARQAEILEQDLDGVVAARERARVAVDELRALNNQLAELLGDFDAPVSEMRRLEGRIATALDNAYQSLQASARARNQVYDQMEFLSELAGQMEPAAAPEPIDADNPEGLWELRLEPIGVRALVELRFQRGGVNNSLIAIGTYRGSNGGSGTLRGTFAGSRMELEVMDERRGKVAEMSGVVGLDGRLEGTWRAIQSGLGESRPAGGTFAGNRTASSEVSFD